MNTLFLETNAQLEQEVANNDPDIDPTGYDIMLYDGLANYCLNSVSAAIEHDLDKRFLFSPLQSVFARKVLAVYGIHASELRSMYIICSYNMPDEHLRMGAPAVNYLLGNLYGEMKKYGQEIAQKSRQEQDADYQKLSDKRYSSYGKFEKLIFPEENRKRYIF